jgi:hypothetical protein
VPMFNYRLHQGLSKSLLFEIKNVLEIVEFIVLMSLGLLISGIFSAFDICLKAY